MSEWRRVCAVDEIELEEPFRFDYGGATYLVYHTKKGFFATDGLCTHEEQHLEDGTVIGNVIECPLHQGRFDITTGAALGAPVCEDLVCHPVKQEDGDIFIKV